MNYSVPYNVEQFLREDWSKRLESEINVKLLEHKQQRALTNVAAGNLMDETLQRNMDKQFPIDFVVLPTPMDISDKNPNKDAFYDHWIVTDDEMGGPGAPWKVFAERSVYPALATIVRGMVRCGPCLAGKLPSLPGSYFQRTSAGGEVPIRATVHRLLEEFGADCNGWGFIFETITETLDRERLERFLASETVVSAEVDPILSC